MIEVLIVDDHPALREGLERVLRLEPGIVPRRGVADGQAALTAAEQSPPDCVVVDYQLPDSDGLSLCRQLKRLPDPPGVVVYTAFADERLALPTLLAGADGLVDKAAPLDEVLHAIRIGARGGHEPLDVPPEVVASGALALPAEDLPIFGMRLDRTPVGEIAATLDTTSADVETRLDRMIGFLESTLEVTG